VFIDFLPICKNYKIIMHINDSLVYKKDISWAKLGRGKNIPAFKINKTDSVMKFRVQINENDTSFFYNVATVDSMLIGLRLNQSNIDLQRAYNVFHKKIKSDSLRLGKHDGFFIFTEQDYYQWLSE